ncbi:PF12668 family protein [Lachnoanaerobaculum sp. MSX33]|uniref:DUF3791 domain-containing protein n=1 Tax=Lachnoanaerobaculum TaxID=1164882 RepID=UPI0002825837|nr:MULTISPECIES: DUF3791 domain-containing protein [unclassified Lachnoanaerobaculum]EJZ69313.1 hypothetical protein HMPREF1135_02207 [Lachnoanaerobaculum sp. OBRC5-5]ETO99127.1 PF12668 family protein [Lachnoanaerobaculum sp. MSX33]GMO02829.1 hypothetical protein LSA36186_10780 [Lachnoanaerobaculum sp. JCM 36186]
MEREIIYDISVLEYVLFCIEGLAKKLGKDGREVYQILTEDSDILNSYIVPSYDVLHTQGKDYIIEDILDVMKKRGLTV